MTVENKDSYINAHGTKLQGARRVVLSDEDTELNIAWTASECTKRQIF